MLQSLLLRQIIHQGLGDPERFLVDNNSYEFFLRLGDLVKTGPTATNVGDVQILLTARKS